MKRSALFFGVSLWFVGSSADAQVHHRRPMEPAPNVNYHFDNNSGSGCRDYNCGARCYDGHSGTDFGIPTGTPVLAGADGVVIATNNGCANTGYVGNPCGGRCGNYVQLEHSDGSRSIYCHMQLNSLSVSRGQRVRCGQMIGRSASSGSSSGPHLHFGWRRSASAASADSYRGRCTSSPGAWVDQRAYPQSPAATCACVPTTEVCNGRDDDCDGRIDEGLTRNCYTGPAGTNGRGICNGGTETCSAGRWGTCTGQVLPRTETCNRMDDDCDGRVDDGVCVMDAGRPDVATDAPSTDVAPDAVLRTDAMIDARSDVTMLLDASVDTVVVDEGEVDAAIEDAEPPGEDAEFVDLGPVEESDADVSPDRVDVQGGCGCRASGSGAQRKSVFALGMLGLLLRVRRRKR